MPDARLHFQSTGTVRRTEANEGSVSLATFRWLAELPENFRPRETAARFPHIANSLCTRWQAPMACREYFDELLLDARGDRRGFPTPVARELVALKDYYESVVFPTVQTAWDEVARQSRG